LLDWLGPRTQEDGVLTYVFSGLALITSVTSLGVSVLTYRMAGPKVTLVGHSFSLIANEVWLQVKETPFLEG
jgi:hypothetical protein